MSRSTKNLAHSIDAHQLAMRCYYNQLPEIYRAKGRRRKEKEKSASNFEAAE